MKVYILTIHQVNDCEDLGIITKAYDSEEKAIAALKAWRDDEIQYFPKEYYVYEHDEPTWFEVYQDGRYCYEHSLGTVQEIEVE